MTSKEIERCFDDVRRQEIAKEIYEANEKAKREALQSAEKTVRLCKELLGNNDDCGCGKGEQCHFVYYRNNFLNVIDRAAVTFKND